MIKDYLNYKRANYFDSMNEKNNSSNKTLFEVHEKYTKSGSIINLSNDYGKKYSDSYKKNNQASHQNIQMYKKNGHLRVGSQVKENKKEVDLIRKLNCLKQQFKEVPNWENFAKSILFTKNQCVEERSDRKGKTDINFYKSRTPDVVCSKNTEDTNSQFYKKHNLTLVDSNLSFKIRETSSIEEPKRKQRKQDSTCLENIKFEEYPVQQFQLYHNQQKQDHKKQETIYQKKPINRKGSQIDERMRILQQRIKDCQVKKKNLYIEEEHKYKPINRTKLNSSFSLAKMNFNESKYPIKPEQMRNSSVLTQKYRDISKPPKYRSSISKTKDLNNDESELNIISPRFAKQQKQDIRYPTKLPRNSSQQNYNKYKIQKNKDISLISSMTPNKKTVEQWSIYTKGNIQTRKRVINEYTSPKSRKQISILVKALSQQVGLDEKLRNNKLWLQTQRNENKWICLQNLLQAESIRLTTEQTKKLFSLDQEQDNPFFSAQSFTSDLNSVLQSFIKSEEHWTKKIQKKFNIKTLKAEGFNEYTVDLGKKDHIALEDLVRFLNMETGTFFRNRDLLAIFRRLGNSSKISFDELIDTLCF